MTRASADELSRWRAMPATEALTQLVSHAKQDAHFTPVKDPDTTRWHVDAAGRDFELLLKGPKFFDTQALRGGGGAVDLAMHLFGMEFRKAVSFLRSRGL